MADRHVLQNRPAALGYLVPRMIFGDADISASAGCCTANPSACPAAIEHDIEIKITSDRVELEQAFELLATSYRERGYETAGPMPFRFTPYHILPDTVTLVAKRRDRVVATLSVVPDTTLLGLPMEGSYSEEIREFRRQGRRLAEAISLADRDLTIREFIQVFQALIRLGMQHHVSRGGDTWVIAVNPRHSNFYRKTMGFEPLGPRRSYPSVQEHPAEAYWLSVARMRSQTPEFYQRVFGELLSKDVLASPAWSTDRVRHFGYRSTQVDPETVDRLILQIEHLGSLPRWLEDRGPLEVADN